LSISAGTGHERVVDGTRPAPNGVCAGDRPAGPLAEVNLPRRRAIGMALDDPDPEMPAVRRDGSLRRWPCRALACPLRLPVTQTGTRRQFVFTPAPNRLVQKSGLFAVGRLMAVPVKASCVVSAQTISGHWPNGLNGRR
jgi:hypothetical protein